MHGGCFMPQFRVILLAALFAGWAGMLSAETETTKLVVAVSLDIPPYVMEKGTKGLEIDLMRAALKDHSLQFIQMSYQELQGAIANKKADIAVAVRLDSSDGVFYSSNFLTFHNAAITKKANGLHIKTVADLKNHTVLTWQNADKELGKEFKQLFSPGGPAHKNYKEVADQRKQVQLFWQGEGEVIVIDVSIFRHFTREMGQSMDEVGIHSIFPPETRFRVGFKDAATRDLFNARLAEMRRSGAYQELLKRYHVATK